MTVLIIAIVTVLFFTTLGKVALLNLLKLVLQIVATFGIFIYMGMLYYWKVNS